MHKQKCENPDCGVMFDTEYQQTRFCRDCAKSRKVERDKKNGKKYAFIAIPCKGKLDKEKMQAVFRAIEYELTCTGGKVSKYEIAERALTMYLEYLQENE